jgi:hypothetical protein
VPVLVVVVVVAAAMAGLLLLGRVDVGLGWVVVRGVVQVRVAQGGVPQDLRLSSRSSAESRGAAVTPEASIE